MYRTNQISPAFLAGLLRFRGHRMTDRIRGRKLQRIRNRVLKANPLCEGCGLRAAVEVDHIKPIFKGGEDSLHSDANRQALCGECHATKTARDLNQRPQIGLDGYPVEPDQTKYKPER